MRGRRLKGFSSLRVCGCRLRASVPGAQVCGERSETSVCERERQRERVREREENERSLFKRKTERQGRPTVSVFFLHLSSLL